MQVQCDKFDFALYEAFGSTFTESCKIWAGRWRKPQISTAELWLSMTEILEPFTQKYLYLKHRKKCERKITWLFHDFLTIRWLFKVEKYFYVLSTHSWLFKSETFFTTYQHFFGYLKTVTYFLQLIKTFFTTYQHCRIFKNETYFLRLINTSLVI